MKEALLATVFALGFVGSASAAVVVLDFDNLNGAVNESPLNYYDGGSGSAGTGPGPNYGITFSADAITGITQPNPGANTNSALNPSAPNLLFFLTGPGAIMNVSAGFTTGFSFFYSAVNQPGLVEVYSGLNSTGSLLASLILPTTPNGASVAGCLGTNFCPYSPVGVAFAGTALSVNFSGTANQVAFDDITLGASTPGTNVPEPASMAVLGLGLLGLGLARRKRG